MRSEAAGDQEQMLLSLMCRLFRFDSTPLSIAAWTAIYGVHAGEELVMTSANPL